MVVGPISARGGRGLNDIPWGQVRVRGSARAEGACSPRLLVRRLGVEGTGGASL